MYEIPGTLKDIYQRHYRHQTLKILAIETLEICTRGNHYKDTPEISECRHSYIRTLQTPESPASQDTI